MGSNIFIAHNNNWEQNLNFKCVPETSIFLEKNKERAIAAGGIEAVIKGINECINTDYVLWQGLQTLNDMINNKGKQKYF